MAATKREMVDDIELRLTQGKPSADFEIPKAQIGRWVDVARDKYVTEYIVQTFKFGGVHDVDPLYIENATGSLTAVTGIGHKTTLGRDILSIPPQDAGIVQVRLIHTATDTYTKVLQTDIFTNDLVEDMEFSSSTLAKPTFYRIGRALYIKGLGSITVGDYTVDIQFIEGMTGGGNEYKVSDSHAYDITLLAEEIGRRELGMSPLADEVNDGSQNSQLNNKR
jgi:hypothetical protein